MVGFNLYLPFLWNGNYACSGFLICNYRLRFDLTEFTINLIWLDWIVINKLIFIAVPVWILWRKSKVVIICSMILVYVSFLPKDSKQPNVTLFMMGFLENYDLKLEQWVERFSYFSLCFTTIPCIQCADDFFVVHWSI